MIELLDRDSGREFFFRGLCRTLRSPVQRSMHAVDQRRQVRLSNRILADVSCDYIGSEADVIGFD